MHSSLIDTQTLANMIALGNSNLVILYTTMDSGPAIKPDIILQQSHAKIPNSRLFDFVNDIVDDSVTLKNMMPPLQTFEDKVRRLGINQDSDIVVYDDFGNFCASRVWFMFKACGFHRIRVLDGGLPAWVAQGFETHSGVVESKNRGDFIARVNETYQFVDAAFVLEHSKSARLPIIDARSRARFEGQEAENRHNVRPGHIPSSINLHYARLFTNDARFRHVDELRQVFPLLENGAIFSCGSGVTACLLAQAADMLGVAPLYVYDGSWSEWGGNHSLPVATGQ